MVCIIWSFSARSSSTDLPLWWPARSTQANSRSLRVMKVVISRVEEEQAVSGIASLGTTPYFSMRLQNISHWPPSFRGAVSRWAMTRPLVGSSRVSKMLSRK